MHLPVPRCTACPPRHFLPFSSGGRNTVARQLSRGSQGDVDNQATSVGANDGTMTFGPPGRQPGEVLVDKYKIIERLGEGSSSVTYSATAPNGRRVAVKELSLGRLKSWKQFDLFEREARTLQGLSHPSIPQYVDYHQVEGCFFLVQELAEGCTLEEAVRRGATMSEQDVEHLAREMLVTLQYLSSRRPPVIHRDIKPANIVIEGGAAGGRALLVDFGGVQDTAQVDANKFGTTIVGTAGYMSPEQFGGAATPAADLYSLGAVLLFALSGRNPNQFRSQRLKLQMDDVAMGPKLRSIVSGFLEPITEDRLSVDQALAILDGKAVPSQASGKVTLPTADRERRWEASEEAARLQRAQQQDGYGMTFRTPQPWRSAPIRQPAGSAVVLTQSRDVMTLDIPARGLTGDALGTGAFAVAWNAFCAVWTVGALTTGGGLFALFSIPFWLSGGGLIRNAARAALRYESFEIAGDMWEVKQKMTQVTDDVAKVLGRGFGTVGGSTADLLGARVVITQIVNGAPKTAIEITENRTAYRIAEALTLAEQEWLVGRINSQLEGMGQKVEVENESQPSGDIEIVNDRNSSQSNWDD